MSELPPDDVLDRIGDEVEAAQRAGRSIDPRELAERLGVDIAVVEAYQVGEQAFDPTPPTVQRILDEGRYIQPRLVSRGGMGAVYRARDARLERDVAIKILRAGAFATPTQRERFLREARAAAQLRHSHALAIHDLGQAGDELYLILEFVDGGRTFTEAASEWGWRETALAVRDAARAVGQAHRLGLIHRDLKPDNMLVDARGHVRVVDFGLARPTDATSLTKTGMIVGTAGYLSPEQARGESSEQGPATDVWSLGVVLYEALGGAQPFPGTLLEFLAALQQRRAPTPLRSLAPHLPAQLGRVCARALAFDAIDRYPDGDAFADALEIALGDSAAPPGGVSLATLVLACLAGLVVGALVATAAQTRPEPVVAIASPAPTRIPARAVAEPDLPPLDVAPLTTAADAQITHVDARAPVGVAFAVDGSLVSYGLGGLRRWRRSGKPRGSWLPGAIASVVPLRDGDWVFATPRQLVRRSIFRQGLPPAKPGAGWTIPVPGVTVVGASPSTQVLAFGAKASGVHLVNAEEGRPRRLCSPEGVLRDLVFLEEGRLLIHVERQGGSRLELWDTIRSARVAMTAVPSLTSVAVSPSGEVLACGFVSGRLTLNAPETLARRQVLSDPRLGGGRAFDGGVGPLAFAPERSEGGALYASPARDVTDADRRLKRFTLPSGAVRDVTPPLPSSPCALTVDPAGTLALGYRDGRAELRRPPLR